MTRLKVSMSAFAFMTVSSAAFAVDEVYDPVGRLIRCLESGGAKKKCKYICSD